MNKETQSSRSLKRLVMRLAFCARFDLHAYFKTGLGEMLREVGEHALESLHQLALLGCALVVLFLFPVAMPMGWLWHAIVNASRVEKLMTKSHNDKLTDEPASDNKTKKGN